MRFIAPIMLATALLVIMPVSEAKPEEEKRVNVERVLQSLVQIYLEKIDGESGSCTGFVVDLRGRIVTATHCVEGTRIVRIGDKNGPVARVLKTEGWITILSGEPGVKPPLPLAKHRPQIQETVWVFGNANGWGQFVLKRNVAAVLELSDDPGHFDVFVDAPIAGGQSGGPIVNAKGEVVAVNQLTFPAMGLGCGADSIKKALK